ncbi:MAG: SusC/RagA family TonB-linked outer membrane protein [Chitinophagaceae bacterium]|nr:SusC/RagA family TonB-linked outer membrane protein [Chitinophagaceae bacterium]
MRKLLALLTAFLFFTGQLFAQKTITGKVTDEKGNPIPNASVMVKGTNTGTVSKSDGSYSITVPANAKALVFSAVDMSPLEVVLGSQTTISPSLKPVESVLAEVVVVGYGTQKKKEVTGSLTTVKGGVTADKPVQTFEQALGGRAAGVQVTIPNGVLNSPPVFRIRGTNSISLSSYPLIVVDGIPSYTGDFSSTAASGNALGSINPNDIESIDIAKDAASTAIYGSRAANGVVFITTKKGKNGKARVSYNGWVSFTNVFGLPDLLNASEYLSFKTSAVANNPTASSIVYSSVNGPDGQPTDTKWSDYIYRQGFSHSHSLNVSGGSDNTTYYFSAGYTDQEGILKKNDFKRMNTLLNVDSRVSKIFSVGGKLAYSNEKNLAATTSGSLNGSAFNTGGLGRLAFVLPPIISPYKNDGTYNINGAAIGSANIAGISSLSYYNPVVPLDLSRSNSENNRIQANAYAQLKPFNWLTLKTAYGIDYLLVDNDIFWTPVSADGYSFNGYAWAGAEKYKTSLWTNTAQFEYSFLQKHNVNLLVGNEQQRRTSSGYGIQRQGLSDLAYNVVQAGFTTNNPADLVLGENYLLSTFGRLNYNYAGKYFLSGNVRQDEYSALGVKKGTFWGASAGWEINKENFWASAGLNNVFSSFRIRGSYGKVGNIGGIGDYTPYSTFGSGLYGGSATLAFSSVGNDKLQWETSKKTDIGFSFGLFRDRLTAEFAYYKNDIDGLILNVQQSPSTGLPSSPPQNIGSMYNKGVELTLNATPISNKDFNWTSSFNITFNKNEVTSLAPGLPYILTSTSGLETVSRTEPGYSLGYLWVIRTNGVDPSTGKRVFVNSANTNVYYQYYAPTGTYNYSTQPDGTVRYISPTNATAISQAADAVMYANTQPKQYGGWDNTFRYKNFDLNVLATYQLGFYVYYGSNAGLHDQRWWNNDRDVLTQAWSKPGDANKLYARPVYGDNVSNGSAMPMDINVFKGDFVKLRSISIGYSLPKEILGKAKISSLRLYVSGQNLAIISKYPGPDPEVSSNGNTTTGQGVDRNTAANARTILIGLNVGF